MADGRVLNIGSLARASIALAALGLALAAPRPAVAEEFHPLYRSSRSAALGGTGVALSEDDQAIFMNPAALAGEEKTKIHYATVDIDASSDIVTAATEGLSAFSGGISGEAFNAFFGKNIYARGQATPSFVTRSLGLAMIVDGQVALKLENKAMPQTILAWQNTNGVQAAFGLSLNPSKRYRSRQDIRIGVAAKMLYRRGGYRHLSLYDLTGLGKDTLKNSAGPFGVGYGADAGTQYVFRFNERITLYGGLTYTEIGDVQFGAGPEAIKGNLSTGFAARYDMRRVTFNLLYDYRNILQDTDWRKRNHIGLEIDLPIVDIYGGVNQVYLTYGASVDLWLIKITGLSYAEEVGTFVHIDPDRRYMLRLDMTLNL